MILGISGHDGSGKTEISKYISSKYNLTLVDDQLREYLENFGYKTFFEIQEKEIFFNNILEKLENAHNRSSSYIIDRSAIDYWVIWQRWFWNDFSPDKTNYILQRIESLVRKYTKAIILPFNPKPTYDGYRFINKYYISQYYFLSKSFVFNFPNLTEYHIIEKVNGLDEIKKAVDLLLG